MNLTIIGTGYVGLVTGVCLSDKGNRVTCIDNNVEKIEALRKGEIPIYEPGLAPIVLRNYKDGNLEFDTEMETSVEKADIIFLALPTPPQEDGSADLSYIFDVVKTLPRMISKYTVIVVKSTVPVGTGDKIQSYLERHLNTSLFDVVSNPEFLREGAAVKDFMNPDRIIIGTKSQRAREKMLQLYKIFETPFNSIICMDRRSSELSKYASNCFLATKISFMNEMSILCDKLGANIDDIKKGIGTDSRISDKFLNAGIGYGGSCFPKDVKALIQTSKEVFYTPKILLASERVNKEQKTLLIKMLDNQFNNRLHGKNIMIWGGAFKPETDDIRESPSLEIIKSLLAKGAKVSIYDPKAMNNIQKTFGTSITYSNDKYEQLSNCDALLITTEWDEFKDVNLDYIKLQMNYPLILDGRNIFDNNALLEKGFIYKSVGRPLLNKEATNSSKIKMAC